MKEPSDDDLATLLERAQAGDSGAREELAAHVYQDLRRLARRYMSDQAGGHTLQTTALVHEAWLRLNRGRQTPWTSKRVFLQIAATAMRSVLVDHARSRNAVKRGGGAVRLQLDEASLGKASEHEVVLMLDDALQRLAEIEPVLAQVAEMRLFLQQTCVEVAEAQGVSARTVERSWRAARAWLERELGGNSR